MLTGAARRRVFGEYQSSEPSRFIDEVPAELIERIAPSLLVIRLSGQLPALRVPDQSVRPRRRGGDACAKTRRPTRTRTRISRPGWRCGSGMRVRHPQFGVGTVLSVEALDDDTKLVVRFDAVGQKTLRAKYARLEPPDSNRGSGSTCLFFSAETLASTLIRAAALIVAAVIVFGFVLLPIRMYGISMLPTYATAASTSRIGWPTSGATPARGDVVAIRMAGEGVVYVKRIVGLPGERLEISMGVVMVNGEPLRRTGRRLQSRRGICRH